MATVVHIPVRKSYSYYQVTVQSGYREDGEFILEHCNHHGAETVEACNTTYDPVTETTNDNIREVLECDKCGAQYDEVFQTWD